MLIITKGRKTTLSVVVPLFLDALTSDLTQTIQERACVAIVSLAQQIGPAFCVHTLILPAIRLIDRAIAADSTLSISSASLERQSNLKPDGNSSSQSETKTESHTKSHASRFVSIPTAVSVSNRVFSAPPSALTQLIVRSIHNLPDEVISNTILSAVLELVPNSTSITVPLSLKVEYKLIEVEDNFKEQKKSVRREKNTIVLVVIINIYI